MSQRKKHRFHSLAPGSPAKVEEITPDEAQAFLDEFNPNNRPITSESVARVELALREGQFMITGQAIIFDWDGNLVDGQHRLSGIAKAGISAKTYVVTGVDPAAFKYVDDGKKRSPYDALIASGITKGTARVLSRAGVIGLAHCMGLAPDSAAGYHSSNYRITDFITKERPDLHYCAAFAMSLKPELGKYASVADIAGIHFVMSDLGYQAEFEDFMRKTALMEGGYGSRTMKLWETLVSNKGKSSEDRWSSRWVTTFVVQAFIAELMDLPMPKKPLARWPELPPRVDRRPHAVSETDTSDIAAERVREYLIERGPTPVRQIGSDLSLHSNRLQAILADLVEDGFLVKPANRRQKYQLAAASA